MFSVESAHKEQSQKYFSSFNSLWLYLVLMLRVFPLVSDPGLGVLH